MYQTGWKDIIPEEDKTPGRIPLFDNAKQVFISYLTTLDQEKGSVLFTRYMDIAAILIKEFGLGYQSLTAAALWYPASVGYIDPGKLTEDYDPLIGELVTGIIKLDKLDTTKTDIHKENFIQLIISLSQDVRILLIKLAESLVMVRDIKNLTEADQLRVARESSLLYGPIAHRLGLYRAKTEFEETGMKYLHSDAYRYIARRLNETKTSREGYIKQFIEPLQKLLDRNGYFCEIKGRPKSIHSIWKKMQSQSVEFEEVYDLFAIRIILKGKIQNDKADCWQVYSLVTDLYQPNPNRLRDWISAPKLNGYESLHTTVIGPEGKWVEVQIRTQRMDEVAEMGHAAHWKYKENRDSVEMDDWLGKIRSALLTAETMDDQELLKAKSELYSDQIYIFTPQNDLIKLKAGSTILDFAFAVHSNIGYHCTGAKVNGRMVPIKHVLINGDQVEIMTSSQQKPKSDWLNIVVTTKARSRIKRVLKEADFQNAEEGKETLKRKFEQWRVNYDVSTIHRLVNYLKVKDALDLYQLVADNKVDLQAVKVFLKDKDPAEYIRNKTVPEKSIENFERSALGKEDCLIIDDQLVNIDYKLARCCHPIFGDEVFGFVTVSGGTKIHRVNCPNAQQMISRYPYRIVKVRWTDEHADMSKYTVNINVTGMDDIGILNEISRVISSDLRINMRAMNIQADDGIFNGRITLIVSDKNHLETVMSKVRQVKGVLSVQRSDE